MILLRRREQANPVHAKIASDALLFERERHVLEPELWPEKLGAQSSPKGSPNDGPAPFLPCQREFGLTALLRRNNPSEVHGSFRRREGAVFDRVGGEFVEGKDQWDAAFFR